MKSHQTPRPLRSRISCRLGLFALLLAASTAVCHAAPPLSIALVSGTHQTTTYGSAFTQPLVVQVTDSVTHAPVSGVQVNFTSTSTIQLSALSASTDVNGDASVTGTGIGAGAAYVIAQIASSPSASVKFVNQVNKVPLTIVPYNEQSIVGVIPQLSGYSLTGFVNGDNATTAHVTGYPTLSTTATASSPASNYPLRSAVHTLSAPNYWFVAGQGTLTLTGVPICGNLGSSISNLLTGNYGFSLYNQQDGFVGVLTSDGVSAITGQASYNSYLDSHPTQWNIRGNYRIGNGARGSMDLLRTLTTNVHTTAVDTVCFAIDNYVGGVIQSGRMIKTDGYNFTQAGTFYRFDGSVTSAASLSGTYVVGLQGTRNDPANGTPLQFSAVATLNLDGSGNVSGGLIDVDYLTGTSGTPIEQYSEKQAVTGTYTYDPAQNGGIITVNNGVTTMNLSYVAPTSDRLLLVTSDDAVTNNRQTTVPVFSGEGRKQAAGPFSAASISGNFTFVGQGVDAYGHSIAPGYTPVPYNSGIGMVRAAWYYNRPTGTVTDGEGRFVEAGSKSFDGAGTITDQSQFTYLDGTNTATTSPTGTASYTVDATTGRFESRETSTNNCLICGYLVSPNTILALSPGSGLPIFVTLKSDFTAPSSLTLSGLSGSYSVGSVSLISPDVEAFENRWTFDGNGNFSGAGDSYSNSGVVSNFKVAGTYAVSNGTYALTLTGSSSPDFYLYMDAQGSGTIVPYSPTETALLPLLTLNPINP